MQMSAAAADAQKAQGEADDVYTAMESGERPSPTPRNTSLVSRVLVDFRVLDILALAIIALVLAGPSSVNRKQYVPQVTALTPLGATVLADNTAFSYPLKYKDMLCSPITLKQCAQDSVQGPCCDFLADKSTPPGEVISTPALYAIVTLIPLAIMVLRHIAHKLLLPQSETSLRDVLIGYLFTLIMTLATTDMIKDLVAGPRPNHYALLTLASYRGPSAKHWGSTAWRSFCSGHASSSMATMLYSSLLLLDDVRKHAIPLVPQLRTFLVILAFGPVYLAIFISTTRVWDYFHTRADVTCGMGLGAAWALVGHYYVVPSNPIIAAPNKPLKYF